MPVQQSCSGVDAWSGSLYDTCIFMLKLCAQISACCLLAMCWCIPVFAAEIIESEQAEFRVVEVARGLDQAWSFAFLPDGRILVTEKPGALRIISRNGSISAPISGVPDVINAGQGGLLDVALHPNFTDNKLIYITYVGGKDGRVGAELMRGRLDGDELKDVEVLFRANPKFESTKHFGSRITFDQQHKVYISLGDRGVREEAQNRANHLGVSVRLNDDGTVPKDNPFVGKEYVPHIFSFGHRNMQGMATNPISGDIWVHEHGPKGGDEVNILRAGANYGWPIITYGANYSGTLITEETTRPGMEQPVLYWVPSIAPSGMAFYIGNRFPEWNGDLFVGALAGRHLRRIELDGDRAVGEEVLLDGLFERIRDVRQSPGGDLYVLTDGLAGKLIRLEPVMTP
jgi:glucose/arabinose dehydrogenase